MSEGRPREGIGFAQGQTQQGEEKGRIQNQASESFWGRWREPKFYIIITHFLNSCSKLWGNILKTFTSLYRGLCDYV